jgi:ankyrin repeat protein
LIAIGVPYQWRGRLGEDGAYAALAPMTNIDRLLAAATVGDLSGIAEAGAPIDARGPSGTTVLHAAATHEGEPIFETLVRRSGLPVDVRDAAGCTPLHFASGNGCPKIIEVLLSLGADANAVDAAGRSALDCAIDAAEPLTIAALLEGGATRCAPGALLRAANQESAPAILRLAVTEPLAITSDGRTLLHLSAPACAPEAVSRLIAAGVPVDARDARGDTALHLACGQSNAATVQALLAGGADPRASDAEGQTPLHRLGPPATPAHVDALLAAGADLNQRNHAGLTALEHALELDLHPACELLGAHYLPGPAALSSPGWSVVHYAAALGSAGAVQALRGAGRLDEPSEDGFTVLHQAVAFGVYRAVEALLQQGSTVDARATDGRRPIELAGSEELQRLLIAWGAAPP